MGCTCGGQGARHNGQQLTRKYLADWAFRTTVSCPVFVSLANANQRYVTHWRIGMPGWASARKRVCGGALVGDADRLTGT